MACVNKKEAREISRTESLFYWQQLQRNHWDDDE
jgi:hypothetical protein